MTILALEFSSSQRSVAIVRGDFVFEAVETGGRGMAAFAMIEKILAEAEIEREEIETIAVGIGPGSYTGIRAAIAIAQGWQLARKIKFAGIGSVEAIAEQARVEKIFGSVNVLMDAQQNEFYLATFEISENGWREILPLEIVAHDKIQPRANAGEIFLDPHVQKDFPAGRNFFPHAATVAALAAKRKDFVSAENLEPIYLRKTNFVKASPPRL